MRADQQGRVEGATMIKYVPVKPKLDYSEGGLSGKFIWGAEGVFTMDTLEIIPTYPPRGRIQNTQSIMYAFVIDGGVELEHADGSVLLRKGELAEIPPRDAHRWVMRPPWRTVHLLVIGVPSWTLSQYISA